MRICVGVKVCGCRWCAVVGRICAQKVAWFECVHEKVRKKMRRIGFVRRMVARFGSVRDWMRGVVLCATGCACWCCARLGARAGALWENEGGALGVLLWCFLWVDGPVVVLLMDPYDSVG